jgi:hypothetical protein
MTYVPLIDVIALVFWLLQIDVFMKEMCMYPIHSNGEAPQNGTSTQVTHLLPVLICCVWLSGFPPCSSPHRIVLVQDWWCEDASYEIADEQADLLLLIVNEAAGSWSVARSTC